MVRNKSKMSVRIEKLLEHPVCCKCIQDHMKKYENFVDSNGKTCEEFSVPCQGIPQTYISEKLKTFLTPQEQLEVIEMYDPAVWARNWIKLPDQSPWIPRWYQEDMLRCSSSRSVVRAGRRTGKCLEEGTPIMTPNGPVEIQNLKIGDLVYAYHTITNSITLEPVIQVHDQGRQQVVDLYRHSQKILSCTPIHRWHTTDMNTKRCKVSHLQDFSKDTAITRRFVDIPMGHIYEPHAYAIGALLGDRCSHEQDNKIYISSEDSVVPNAVATCLGVQYGKNNSSNHTWVLFTQRGRNPGTSENIDCHYYREWCKNRYAHEKNIDLEVVKTWDRTSCLALLAGLLDTGGCVQLVDRCLSISWDMQAQSVIKCIQYLLLALFQYKANISVDRRSKYQNRPVYHIGLKDNLFCKRILKELDPFLHVVCKKYQETYQDLLENNENPDLYGVKFDLDITHEAHCWDISINTPDNLYLTAHGLVTHNTDSIAIKILHTMFFNANKRILVVCPYKSQAEEIVTRVRSFIQSSQRLIASVKRDVSSPFYELSFHNGSRLRAFSSGTKSGAEGASIRGQDADEIYIDEFDYLTDGDINAIIAIVNTHPKVKLWVSSTPTGRRSQFWRLCLKSPSYKEFYHPSSDLPHWKQIEEQIRADYAGQPDGWTHEIEAKFGEEGVSLFQHELISAALDDYKYGSYQYNRTWIYSMGIDWNTDHGTEICVVGFDRSGGFRVVDSVNIGRQGWTQLAGINAIIELNKKWQPSFIYADQGAGATAIELLRMHGQNSLHKGVHTPDARLRTIVHAYDFGSKIEAHDPMTKQPIKKHAKPFLVENAIRFFEEKRIKISEHDTILRDQLGNYIVKHRTTSGVPVYGQTDEKIGDHRLDAMMLALVGFKLEISDFGRPIFDTHIAISPGFGKNQQDRQTNIDHDTNRTPEPRFEMPTSRMPGITNSGKIAETRPGWDTDEEDKYRRAIAIRKARQPGRGCRNRPVRSTF